MFRNGLQALLIVIQPFSKFSHFVEICSPSEDNTERQCLPYYVGICHATFPKLREKAIQNQSLGSHSAKENHFLSLNNNMNFSLCLYIG